MAPDGLELWEEALYVQTFGIPPAARDSDGDGISEAFAIIRIELDTSAQIPGIDDATFQKHAADAKQNCPVSRALAGTKISLKATLGYRSLASLPIATPDDSTL